MAAVIGIVDGLARIGAGEASEERSRRALNELSGLDEAHLLLQQMYGYRVAEARQGRHGGAFPIEILAALEHTERLSYLEYRGAGYKKQMTRKLHGPILEAIRKRDPAAARKAVLNDITQAQVMTSGVPPEINLPYMARTNSRVR